MTSTEVVPQQVEQLPSFVADLKALRDPTARARIAQRLAFMQNGLFGDTKSLGGGLHELRIHSGPGYRIYYAHVGSRVVVLLSVRDKSRQSADIARARQLLAAYEAEG